MSIYLIIILSLATSAFFSGMEIAFISANKLKMELDLKSNSPLVKYLAKVFRSPSRFIATMLVGNNVALVIYGISMAEFLQPKFEYYLSSPSLILLFQTIFSTIIILVTAEFLPKAIFRIHSNRFLKGFSIPLILFYFLLYPIVSFTLFISDQFMKIVGVKLVEDSPVFKKVDIEDYLNNYSKNKNSEEGDMEVQIMQNALDFSKVKSRECMIPRTEIIAIDISKSIDDLKTIFIRTKLSKVVIYQDNIDQVIGYAHSYDLFKDPSDIKSILLPIPIVTETMLANELLELFIEKRRAIAVVVDEFGGTSGIITIEDVMEEIFGEIEDEFDADNEFESQIDENSFVFSARIEVDYLNDKYDFGLEVSDEYETLAGYLLSHLEEIPSKGTIVEAQNYRFIIEEVSEIKIEKIRLEKS
ncbi:MAG: hemolysin family protein [Flavobacteriales bacterium]|tara:strand:- start:56590 stop:57834 length:1245 start_codon:yes stop_codon:yes gene_type:complete